MTKLAVLLFAAVLPACVEMDDPATAQSAGDLTCIPCLASPSLVADGGFELGGAWQLVGNAMRYTDASWEHWSRSGSSFGLLGRDAYGHDALYQTVTIPANVGSATLTYYVSTFSSDFGGNDPLSVMVVDTAWHTIDALHARDATETLDYKLHTNDLSAYRGKTVGIWFWADQSGANRTEYLIDDVSLTTTPLNKL